MSVASSNLDIVRQNVATALTEDIGDGDVSVELLANDLAQATVISREHAVLAGSAWFEQCFLQLDSSIEFAWQCQDGDALIPGQEICTLNGHAHALLSAERCALNFLQTLSATATQVHQFQKIIADLPCKLLDTRKTIPNLRYAQKYAVTCGGGYNHRMGLYDGILIKENHIATAGGIIPAVTRARQRYPNQFIEVEVENLVELGAALTTPINRIMLDNFSLPTLHKAVTLADHKIDLEASGNVSINTIRAIAESGVDYVSVGALTKNIQAIDLSMRIHSHH